MMYGVGTTKGGRKVFVFPWGNLSLAIRRGVIPATIHVFKTQAAARDYGMGLAKESRSLKHARADAAEIRKGNPVDARGYEGTNAAYYTAERMKKFHALYEVYDDGPGKQGVREKRGRKWPVWRPHTPAEREIFNDPVGLVNYLVNIQHVHLPDELPRKQAAGNPGGRVRMYGLKASIIPRAHDVHVRESSPLSQVQARIKDGTISPGPYLDSLRAAVMYYGSWVLGRGETTAVRAVDREGISYIEFSPLYGDELEHWKNPPPLLVYLHEDKRKGFSFRIGRRIWKIPGKPEYYRTREQAADAAADIGIHLGSYSGGELTWKKPPRPYEPSGATTEADIERMRKKAGMPTLKRIAKVSAPRRTWRKLYALKDVGSYVDSSRGIYVGERVQEIAAAHGWREERLSSDSEFYHEAEDAATEYMNREQAVKGAYWGRNDNGDWGLWTVDENPRDTAGVNWWRVRHAEPKLFRPGSFRTLVLGPRTQVIRGRLCKTGAWATQSVRVARSFARTMREAQAHARDVLKRGLA